MINETKFVISSNQEINQELSGMVKKKSVINQAPKLFRKSEK